MKKILISTTLATLLSTSLVFAEANNTKTLTANAVTTKAVNVAKDNAQKKKDALNIAKEAVNAVALTQKALIDLSKKDTKAAIKDIEDAIGKLEVILANPKAPALIPIDAKVLAKEYHGNSDDISTALISTIALLQNNKIQEARVLLDTLQDEVDFTTVNLPMASYPAALKLAAKYLHEGKVDEAKAVLATTIHTFVSITSVTPISILKAQALIIEASKIAKKDKEKALKYLAEAKEDLKKAELLGYTSRSDTTYKMLKDSIKKVEKEIKGKNKAEKLFEDLINKMKEFKEKAVKSIKG